MPRYAEKTDISSEKTRIEIEKILVRYGATAFQYGWDEAGAMIRFRIVDRTVEIRLPLPDRHADEFTRVRVNQSAWATRQRSNGEQIRAYEQAIRQRWRALALVIKANLEAVEAGITTVEAVFLGQILLPSGETVGDWVGPQIEEVYRTHGMPSLLPGATRAALPPSSAPEATAS